MQRISVQTMGTSGGYSLIIQSVHRVENRLIVLTKHTAPTGAQTSSITFPQDYVVVNTGSDTPLPVVHYATSNEKKFSLRDAETIENEEVIQPLLAQGTCLYRHTLNHNHDLRVQLLEKAAKNPDVYRALQFQEPSTPAPLGDKINLLNMFFILENNYLVVGLESVVQKDVRGTRISLDNLGRLTKSLFSFTDDLFEQQDRDIVFKAMANGQLTSFSTRADVFYLPLHKPEFVFYFLLMLEATLQNKTLHPDKHDVAYTHIQVSQQSILACFEDVCVANLGNYNTRLMNPMTLSIEAFMRKPGTLHHPTGLARRLFTALLATPHPHISSSSNYLQSFVGQFGPTGYEQLVNTLYRFSRALSIGYHTALEEESIEIALELDKLLLNSRFYHRLQPLITAFKEIKSRLLTEMAHFRLPNRELTEVLRKHKLQLRPNNTISLFFDPSHHEETAALQTVMTGFKWEFDTDSDPNRELIFTRKTSDQLRVFGLHIHEDNVYVGPLPSMTASEAKGPALFMPTTVLPYQALSQATDRNADAIAVMLQVGLGSSAAYQLLVDYPNCIPLLSMLHKEKVITTASDSRHALANLVYVTNHLNIKREQSPYFKPKPFDTVASLMKLYQLLGSEPNAKGFLTPVIHHAILRMAISNELQDAFELLECARPLTQQKVDQFFANSSLYFRFNERMDTWPQRLDCLRRFYDPTITIALLTGLDSAFDRYYSCKEWLNGANFTILLDRITEARSIVEGFEYLHKNDSLAEHQAYFLAHLETLPALHALGERCYLNKEAIAICLHDPRAPAAAEVVALCAELQRIHPYQLPPHVALNHFMSNDDLRIVTHHLCTIVKQSRVENRYNSEAFQDLRALMLCAGLEKEDDDHHAFFSRKRKAEVEVKEPVLSLEARLQQLREKYQLNTPAQQRVAMAM